MRDGDAQHLEVKVRTYLLLVGLIVVACDERPEERNAADATPETEAPETEAPLICVDQIPEPVATLENPPKSPNDSRTDLDSAVHGNNITKNYQYVLINTENYDCNEIENDGDVSYGAVTEIGDKLTLAIGANGPKTLCLHGLDEDGRLQNNATRYTWIKTMPKLHSESEIPAAGQPGIGLIDEPVTFASGYGNDQGNGAARSFTIKNIGTGTLKWQAKTASNAEWLQIKNSDEGYVEVKAGKLKRGEIDANTSAFVAFRLAKGRGTDYGEPYQREHEIIFVNEESKHEIKVKVKLAIPKLDTQKEEVELTNNSSPVKVYVKNLNKPLGVEEMWIEVAGGFPITKDDKGEAFAEFKGLVTYETGLASTGTNDGERYVELTLTDAGKESCAVVQQTLVVYSNGDSKGDDNCKVEAGTPYIGGNGNAKWTTGRCKRIVVSFNGWKHLDLNDDDVINILDLVKAAALLENQPDPLIGEHKRADIDGNGKVEQADLAEISACLGSKL